MADCQLETILETW